MVVPGFRTFLNTCHQAYLLKISLVSTLVFLLPLTFISTSVLAITNASPHVITSTREVMFSPGFVCGFVSLFVNKIAQKLLDGF